MPTPRTQMHFLPDERSVVRGFLTGVSLHSHTEHSKEGLRGLPRYLEKMPVVAQFYRYEMKRHKENTGFVPDFSKAYWRGPLSAAAAYDLERGQIEKLGLEAIVSLTDHDNIDAGTLLNTENRTKGAPVSVEWTVPFHEIYFHLGIHNLPVEVSASLMNQMAEYTRAPQPDRLGSIMEKLDADPSVLIVLNHPLWDMSSVGSARTRALFKEFLKAYGNQIHALEINGLRSRLENMEVVKIAQEIRQVVVSGGDRHGCEANALINMTRATTLTEFIDEIRNDRSSNIAVLPQYREPLVLRHLLTAWDAAREHPQLANRKQWINRVFVRLDDGGECPISAFWPEGAPAWINPCLNVVGLLASQFLRTPFRVASLAAGSTVL